MKIVRSRRQAHFTMLPNETIRDGRLSLRARGLLAVLLSYPDDWTTDADELTRDNPEGRDAIRTALRELETGRYLIRQRYRNRRGQWAQISAIYDSPQPPGTELEALDAAPDRDGLSVPVLTSDDAANPQVTTATGKPGSGQPAPVDQALSTEEPSKNTPYPQTDDADGSPPSPDDLDGQADEVEAEPPPAVVADVHDGRHANCRACGTNQRAAYKPPPLVPEVIDLRDGPDVIRLPVCPACHLQHPPGGQCLPARGMPAGFRDAVLVLAGPPA